LRDYVTFSGKFIVKPMAICIVYRGGLCGQRRSHDLVFWLVDAIKTGLAEFEALPATDGKKISCEPRGGQVMELKKSYFLRQGPKRSLTPKREF
jgi:hypothetical protein